MLTQEYLKSILDYNPDTGVFKWAVSKAQRVERGDVAGYDSKGYIRIEIDNKPYFAHRLAFLYMTGEMPVDQVDHKNRVRNDNRWINLKEASNSDNQKNKSLQKNNTSGVVGVAWRETRWVARIMVDKKAINLGSFAEFHEAVNARKNAEIFYGFSENHGKDIL